MPDNPSPFILAHRHLRAANKLLLRRWKLSFFVIAIISLPSLLISVLVSLMVWLSFDRNAGSEFFDPSGNGDPLFGQHLIWFFGHPETLIILSAPVFFLISVWGNAVWWRGQLAPVA